jgi:hypothetical protein
MQTIDDIVFEMNIMLYAREFDKKKFQDLLNGIKDKYHPKTGMLDLAYYNKVRKKELWDQKINAVRNAEFELAASYRRMEILCQNLTKFKIQFKIKRSIFKYEENYLVYLHVGNARNDEVVKEFFNKYYFVT